MPTVATEALLLVHAPPLVASFRLVVSPTQTLDVPVTDAGLPLTVTTFVARQPDANVYDIVAVPADTPVTTPEASIEATTVLLLLHVPLPVTSLSVVVEPAHTLAVPVMADGTALTVTVVVAIQPRTV